MPAAPLEAQIADRSLVAVMGDIVDSEQTVSRRRLHVTFNEAVRRADAESRDALESPLTITLGDEFQGLSRSLTDGLRIVRTIRSHLLAEGVRCRFVLGIVQIETPVNPASAWNMLGAGLAETRAKLEDKKAPNAYRFHIPDPQDPTERLLEAVGYSLTETERGWTPRQLEMIHELLFRGASVEEAARTLGISTRVAYKIRQAARLDFYTSQWDSLAFALKAIDRKVGLP